MKKLQFVKWWHELVTGEWWHGAACHMMWQLENLHYASKWKLSLFQPRKWNNDACIRRILNFSKILEKFRFRNHILVSANLWHLNCIRLKSHHFYHGSRTSLVPFADLCWQWFESETDFNQWVKDPTVIKVIKTVDFCFIFHTLNTMTYRECFLIQLRVHFVRSK